MKANRKFLKNRDEAVSPVIAVILMVAITVVLAATVYVWVSGFGSNSSAPAKSVGLVSAGSIGATPTGTPTIWYKNFTVASATPGMKYSDMSVTLNGVSLTFESACDLTAAGWGACAGATPRATGDVISAGDSFMLRSATSLSGQSLKLVDAASNSVISTLTIS